MGQTQPKQVAPAAPTWASPEVRQAPPSTRQLTDEEQRDQHGDARALEGQLATTLLWHSRARKEGTRPNMPSLGGPMGPRGQIELQEAVPETLHWQRNATESERRGPYTPQPFVRAPGGDGVPALDGFAAQHVLAYYAASKSVPAPSYGEDGRGLTPMMTQASRPRNARVTHFELGSTQ